MRYGDPRLPARFWSKTIRHQMLPAPWSECWVWVRGTTQDGYGWYRHDGHAQAAHRVAYTALVGQLPAWVPGAGPGLDHLCRVRPCVRPAHLELVTQRENTMRGEGFAAERASRTHCPVGHPLVEGNLVPAVTRRGWRNCAACGRLRAKDRRNLILAAARTLGMSRDGYVAAHGSSAGTAESFIVTARPS